MATAVFVKKSSQGNILDLFERELYPEAWRFYIFRYMNSCQLTSLPSGLFDDLISLQTL